MHIHQQNSQHVLEPDSIRDVADDLAYAIITSIREHYTPGVLSGCGVDLNKMQIQYYGTLQVWELVMGDKLYRKEQWFWTFFLFTEKDMGKDFGAQIMDIMLADASGKAPEDFDTFAAASGRQDLYVFPLAGKRLARAIPPLLSCISRRLN